jgi:hypothetical protein
MFVVRLVLIYSNTQTLQADVGGLPLLAFLIGLAVPNGFRNPVPGLNLVAA